MQLYSGPSDHQAWYSVETSQAFHEIKLPVEERLMTAEQRRAYRALLDLSEQYGTHVRRPQPTVQAGGPVLLVAGITIVKGVQ